MFVRRCCAAGLVVEASPVPAGAVKAGGYEQDDQQGDQQAGAQDGGSDGPDQRPLGRVDQGRPEGHVGPPRPPAVLRRIACQVDALHVQRADQASSLVTQLVKGVFAMVTTHAALTWRGHKQDSVHIKNAVLGRNQGGGFTIRQY